MMNPKEIKAFSRIMKKQLKYMEKEYSKSFRYKGTKHEKQLMLRKNPSICVQRGICNALAIVIRTENIKLK